MFEKYKDIKWLGPNMYLIKVTLAALLLIIVEGSIADTISAQKNANQAIENKGMLDNSHTRKTEEAIWTSTEQQQAELEKKIKEQIAQNPKQKEQYVQLAGLYLSNGKTARAIEAYQEAIIHDPENPRLFAAISIAYLHQSKYSMSRAMANEALRLDPELSQVKKINDYIDAKQAIINAANAASNKSDSLSMHNLTTGKTSHKQMN